LLLGQTILVVAHGNSLRSLMMYLEQLSEEEIEHIDLPTGIPRLYRTDDNGRLSYFSASTTNSSPSAGELA
jgi:2,3-bisphosphoglycerate-dependent phosphoglycerate mutase